MIGHLAQNGGVNDEALRAALLHGAVVASHGVEAFSLDRLVQLSIEDISERASALRKMLAV